MDVLQNDGAEKAQVNPLDVRDNTWVVNPNSWLFKGKLGILTDTVVAGRDGAQAVEHIEIFVDPKDTQKPFRYSVKLFGSDSFTIQRTQNNEKYYRSHNPTDEVIVTQDNFRDWQPVLAIANMVVDSACSPYDRSSITEFEDRTKNIQDSWHRAFNNVASRVSVRA